MSSRVKVDSTSTEKIPFEKLRSLIERKKLYLDLLNSSGEMICKSEDGELFAFKPQQIYRDQFLSGAILAIEEGDLPVGEIKIIGNFGVGGERYFFTGNLSCSQQFGMLALEADVFKLQRRQNMRLHIPVSYPLFLNLVKCNSNQIWKTLKIADISAGGLRIFSLEEELSFMVNDQLEGVLHPPSGKTISLQLTVKHHHRVEMSENQLVTQFGCAIQSSTESIKNRMLSLTLDLQQKIIVGGFG